MKNTALDMMSHEVVAGMRRRYARVHPTLFIHSLERASSPGHLFDLLEPLSKFPVKFDWQEKSWTAVSK